MLLDMQAVLVRRESVEDVRCLAGCRRDNLGVVGVSEVSRTETDRLRKFGFAAAAHSINFVEEGRLIEFCSTNCETPQGQSLCKRSTINSDGSQNHSSAAIGDLQWPHGSTIIFGTPACLRLTANS
jgi:hypothetical protein